jgi:lipopolysaccharide export system permease protein
MTVYILLQLLTGTVLVTVGLLCILWLTQSLRFIEVIVGKGASIGTFLTLTGLLLPNFLVYVLPVALFVVVLFTYNRLTTDRELIVLRAAGVGPFGLARPALILALALTLTSGALTLHFVPESVRAFRELQWTVRNDVTGLLIREGAFNTVVPGVTVYVRARSASGELLGLMVHDARHPEETVTLMAERGALIHGDVGPRVLMVNGSRQAVARGSGKLSLLYFDSYTMDFNTSGGGAGERFRDARERPFAEILTVTAEDEPGLSPVDIRRFRVEAHQRLAGPLSCLTLTLVALAGIMSGSFNRRGNGRRISGAIAAMIGVEAMIIGAGNLAAGSLLFLPLVYLAVLVPAGLAVLLLARPGLLDDASRSIGRRWTAAS